MVQERRTELRRAIEDGTPQAHLAEVAPGDGPLRQRLESAILALAGLRGPDSSTCPSDAARTVGGENWRDVMDGAHTIARELAKAGYVEITQRGDVLDPGTEWRGPVRIRAVGR